MTNIGYDAWRRAKEKLLEYMSNAMQAGPGEESELDWKEKLGEIFRMFDTVGAFAPFPTHGNASPMRFLFQPGRASAHFNLALHALCQTTTTHLACTFSHISSRQYRAVHPLCFVTEVMLGRTASCKHGIFNLLLMDGPPAMCAGW